VDWLKTYPADIICIQETKAEKDNIAHAEITARIYQDFWFSAQKKAIAE
jgi:exodeoxyribonuclease-3